MKPIMPKLSYLQKLQLCLLFIVAITAGGALLWRGATPGDQLSHVSPQPPLARSGDLRRISPSVAAPSELVDAMLALAHINSSDIIYDLGCGDGRIVIRAATQYHVRGVGIDIDEQQINHAMEAAQQAHVDKLVTFKVDNILTTPLSGATVVTLFLGSIANDRLRPRLQQQLRPGARVVSLMFRMGDWQPTTVLRLRDHEGISRALYLWEIHASPDRQIL